MRFIDEVTIAISGGNGGNGAVAFRREKYRPKGGPSGGDGGRGGDVIFRADRNIGTLLDLRSRPKISAPRGGDGKGSDCHGRSAEPVVIRVPIGTIVLDAGTDAVLGDLKKQDQEIVAAAGGAGGKGNMRFVTPSNRAPRTAEPGTPGEARKIRLELRLLADVGIIGMPNVGKSTLISKLSAAKPKVADYPFTTLVPNLGVVRLGPEASFVMADIPGLVRGAADGAGLGHRFLRHVQRTATLLHMLAPSGAENEDLLDNFNIVEDEVRAFDPELCLRPKVVAINKCDTEQAREAAPKLRQSLKKRGLDVFLISAITGEGLDDLKNRLFQLVEERSSRNSDCESKDDDSSILKKRK